jgi:uncharacterized protein (TIGR04255 family)
MGISFSRPPVNEVVVGQVFVPRADLLIPHLGEFWATRLKREYPETAHAIPVMTVNEPPYADPLTGIPLPRVWLIGHEKTRMVQLQQDRLYANWRRLRSDDQYVRFPAVRDEFLRVQLLFDEFVVATTKESLKPVRYELTYVNVLRKGVEWNDILDLSNVFRDFGWRATDRFLQVPTRLGARFEFNLPGDVGILSVTADPARDNTTQEISYRLQLSAAAPVDVVSRLSFAAWLDVAHDQIVRGFKDLTTQAMHEHWGLIPEGSE